MDNSELKVIELEEIAVSKTNPRKTFDEGAMRELEESVRQHGVLQPILVRSLVPAGKKSKPFELVCGERRYRAAKAAGLKEIPCNIRMLTDDEAFELQIIENLERKDVHPLEEAHAFKRMLDSGRYTLEDIAGKVVKSVTYVVQRMKFNDLIEEVAADFMKGHLGVGHAILLARLEAHDQIEHYKEARSGWKSDPDNPSYGTVRELRYEIEDGTIELGDVPFSLDDVELVKEAGPCSKCMKRTSCNPVLFSDMQESDRCMDSRCYDKKELAHIERESSKIIDQALKIALVTDWSGTVPPDVAKMCKENKIALLKNYDDYNLSERNGWPMVKAFNVSEGKYMDIYVKPDKVAASTSASDPGFEVKNEIAKLEQRAARALELDGEKVWNTVRNWGDGKIGITLQGLDEDPGEKYTRNNGPLSKTEKMALLAALKNTTYQMGSRFEYLKDLTVKNVNNDEPSEELINQALRFFINYQLNVSYGSHLHSPGNAALYNVFKEYYPAEVDGIEVHFEKLKQKRVERTGDRLSKLRAELKELEPKKPAKRSTPKKKTEKAVANG
nr:ParB/RepB/Spo0J family partition protein [Allomuricauda sp.]